MANPFGKGKTYNLIGKRFHNFVVTARTVNRISKSSGRGFAAWKCLCDCGKEFITTTKQINKDKHPRKSCGCLSFNSQFRRSIDDGLASIRKTISRYKYGAKTRGLSWELSEEECIQLFKGNCNYCGSEPKLRSSSLKNTPQHKISGIDRVDPSIGYTIKNCVSCCTICNEAKMDRTLAEFEEWLNQVVKFRSRK
jgi:hypothetical protein